MKKSYKILMIILLIFLVIFIGYCCTPGGKKKVVYPIQAKVRTTAYIYKRYGVIPKIKEVEIFELDNSGSPIFFPTIKYPTKEAWVYLEHKGKEFEVNISWGSKKQIYDNFQQDVIEQAVKEEISQMIGEPAYISVNSGMLSKYFDGENLIEVLESGQFDVNSAYIFMVGADLSGLTYDKMCERFGENCNYTILNCKDKAAVEKIIQLDTDRFIATGDLEVYSEYLTEYIEFKKYNTNGANYLKMNQYDKFNYHYWNGSFCNVETLEIEDLSNWDEEGKLKDLSVIAGYSLDTDAERVTVIVPCVEYGVQSSDQVKIVQLYENDGKKDFRYESVDYREENNCFAADVYIKDNQDVSFVICK